MTACGPIGLPRGITPGDQRALLGGQNGTVAAPGRLAALAGEGPIDRPGQMRPAGGQHGPVLLARILPQLDRNNLGPGCRPAQDHRDEIGRSLIQYVRRFYENCWPLAHFIAPNQATTSWTTNRASGPQGAGMASPIPMDRRWRALTYREPFNAGRVYSTYYHRERPQRPQALRKLLGGQGYVMRQPYVNRLTKLSEAPSYGQTTATLGG